MYKTSAAYNAFVCYKKNFRHRVRSPFGKRGDDCSTASHFTHGEGELSAALVRIQEERWTSDTSGCSWEVLQSTSACQTHTMFNINVYLLCAEKC